MTDRPALWQCPACERRFANSNQPHACGRYDLEHFAGKPPEVRALFDAVAAEIGALGPVTILPDKTRLEARSEARWAYTASGPRGVSRRRASIPAWCSPATAVQIRLDRPSIAPCVPRPERP